MDYQFEVNELKNPTDVDLSSIQSLVEQLSDDSQELTIDDLRKITDSQNTHLYIVRSENNTIIAMLTLIIYRIPYKMKGFIEDVVVDKNYRGKGIATNLIKHAIDESKKYQVKSLNLTSNPSRDNANSLYQKLGFEKRDTNVYRLMI